MNSMPAASDILASAKLSSQLPVQRSGTRVTARPDEQFEPNRPILSLLLLYMAMRWRMAALELTSFIAFLTLRPGEYSLLSAAGIAREPAKLQAPYSYPVDLEQEIAS